MIASPTVNVDGPKAAYERIDLALANLNARTELGSMSVVGPEDPIVRALAATYQTGPALAGIRVYQNLIGGRYIEDAYLYRLNVSPVAA